MLTLPGHNKECKWGGGFEGFTYIKHEMWNTSENFESRFCWTMPTIKKKKQKKNTQMLSWGKPWPDTGFYLPPYEI